jgi:hypothetical protein
MGTSPERLATLWVGDGDPLGRQHSIGLPAVSRGTAASRVGGGSRPGRARAAVACDAACAVTDGNDMRTASLAPVSTAWCPAQVARDQRTRATAVIRRGPGGVSQREPRPRLAIHARVRAAEGRAPAVPGAGRAGEQVSEAGSRGQPGSRAHLARPGSRRQEQPLSASWPARAPWRRPSPGARLPPVRAAVRVQPLGDHRQAGGEDQPRRQGEQVICCHSRPS